MSNNGNKSSRVPRKTPVAIKDKSFPNMLRVKFEEGGKLPESLSGMFSSKADVDRAIKGWIDGTTRPKIYPRAPANDKPQRNAEKPKVETNGEAESIS